MPIARAQLASRNEHESPIYFIVDQKEENEVNGHYILTYSEFLASPATERFIAVAIADSNARESLTEKCERDNLKAWTISALNNIIMDDVKIGSGSILSPFVTITSNVQIGKSFHANIYSYVAHDCIIGDFVTFAPGVKCNGNVTIGDHAYIGTGAIIRPGKKGTPLTIGEGAIVGMGAIVTKSIPPNTTVFGNPAKQLSKTK